jgi:hypothetical protein
VVDALVGHLRELRAEIVFPQRTTFFPVVTYGPMVHARAVPTARADLRAQTFSRLPPDLSFDVCLFGREMIVAAIVTAPVTAERAVALAPPAAAPGAAAAAAAAAKNVPRTPTLPSTATVLETLQGRL